MVIPNFKGEIESDRATRTKYSRDASLFVVIPQAGVFPRDKDDVKALVRFANANAHLGITLTARAAGTDMSGGPLSESIVVDFTRHMDAVRAVGYGTAVVEPGVLYRDLEKALAARGFLLPSYTASKDVCAVGGMVANNSGGEKTLRYGKTADYVRRLNVVLSDGKEYVFQPLNGFALRQKLRQGDFLGNIYRDMYELVMKNKTLIAAHAPRVSKNSAGYALGDVWNGKTFDLTRLFSGSQGTLGMITEIEFKTVRPKTHSRLLVIFLNDTQKLAAIVRDALAHKPESFESYDNTTLWLGLRYMFFRFGFRFLPEILMAARNGGLPKMVLLLEFTGESDRETRARARQAARDLRQFGCLMRITETAADAEKYWAIRRESFNLLRLRVKGMYAPAFIDDTVVNTDVLSEFFPKIYKILNESGLTMTIAGHIGNGNFHIFPLMDLSQESHRKKIYELNQKVFDLVLSYNGSISGEHNDGLIRSPYIKEQFGGKIYNIFAEIKHIFDPEGIFNPHKKIGVTKEYAQKFLINHKPI